MCGYAKITKWHIQKHAVEGDRHEGVYMNQKIHKHFRLGSIKSFFIFVCL